MNAVRGMRNHGGVIYLEKNRSESYPRLRLAGHVRDGEPIFGGREYCFLRTDGDSDTVVKWANASVRHINGAATPRTTGCED